MEHNKLQILAVEDNPADFRLLEEYLKEGLFAGFEITQAKTLKEAFNISSAEKFDIILLDLGLTDGAGLDNIEQVYRANPAIPIIVLTRLEDEKTGINALQKGAQDYLIKGKIQSDSLIRSMRYAIERKRAQEKITHLASFPQLDPNPIIELDASGKVVFSNLSAIKVIKEHSDINAIELLLPKDIARIIKSLKAGQNKREEFMREIQLKESFFIETLTVLPELNVVRIYARDITKRKIAEDQLKKVNEGLEEKVLFRTRELIEINKQMTREIIKRKKTESELSARAILLELLNKAVSRREYVNDVLELIKKWGGCKSAGIRILDEEGRIPFESCIDFSDEFLDLENNLSIDRDRCVCTRVIKGIPDPEDKVFMSKFGSFCCNDTSDILKKLPVQAKANFRGTCIRYGFRSLAVFPIRYQDKIIGTIQIADKKPDKIDSDIREFIESISGLIAAGINKFNLEDKIKKEHDMLDNAQRELERSRRLSDIGTLAATVAHELRNPLAAIHMASYNIRRKAQNPMLDKHIATIEKKVVESDQIINNLLFYSRLKTPQYESVNIYDIIEECIETINNRYENKKIAVKASLQPLKKISMEADPLQMKEVFNNILGNSYDAILNGQGNIEIGGRSGNSFVEIYIKDSGIGISEEDLQKVFDPFFTTKAKGTGLGLSVCKQVVDLHNGTINIASKRDKGSTVTIKLPIHKNGNG